MSIVVVASPINCLVQKSKLFFGDTGVRSDVLFVVPSRADTGVHACVLAMCNESCPRSCALGTFCFL